MPLMTHLQRLHQLVVVVTGLMLITLNNLDFSKSYANKETTLMKQCGVERHVQEEACEKSIFECSHGSAMFRLSEASLVQL